jgi:hypothetical protein
MNNLPVLNMKGGDSGGGKIEFIKYKNAWF